MRSSLLSANLSAPITVTWEITRECNLRCAHCLSGSGTGSRTPLDQAKRIIDQLASLQVFQVDIGGGEPLVHPEIFDILEDSVSAGLVTCLSTNGTMVTEEGARRLAALGIRVQVSLDGATEETNRWARGAGSLRQAIRGLELLSRHDMRLAVNVVLTRINFDELDELLLLARGYGVNLRVSRFRPSGRGTQAWQRLRPTPEQHLQLKIWLQTHPEVLTGDSFFFLWPEGQIRSSLEGCGAGRLTCCISPEGKVFPCAFLQWDAFMAGDLTTHPFSTIWKEAVIFKSMRGSGVSCFDCSRVESCCGGCPAVSYGVNGLATSRDPECIADPRSGCPAS